MAGKRNKSQARRNSGGGGGGGGLSAGVWLLIGLALGIALFLFVPKFLGGKGTDSFFRPKPNADAQPPAIDATSDKAPIAQNGGDATAPDGKPKDKEYDFYTLLPGEETEVSDKELAERARAEEAQRQRDARQAQDAASPDAATAADAKPVDATAPKPIDAAPSSQTTRTPPADAHPKPVASTDAKPVDTHAASTQAASPQGADATAAKADNARYILQAGAFQASGDAEALKARIAFLGLGARVESAQIGGNTVYRVRMGPYGSATELAEAKRKLAGGGLPAVAIKAK